MGVGGEGRWLTRFAWFGECAGVEMRWVDKDIVYQMAKKFGQVI